ncbi:MAG: hypothetical protein JO228_01655 [Xanthobacteraceae bacterium]|nr:hypothetical protein [Xanthobacteraceae bacterium]
MAYTTNTLSYLGGGLVEGAWKEWAYVTVDSIQTVLGAGYIADAALATGGKGMGVGDIVYVINQSLPGAFTLQVAAISGGAATLGVPANAPGESTIFGGSAQGTSLAAFSEEGNLYRSIGNPIAGNGADTTDDVLAGVVIPAGAFDAAGRGLYITAQGITGPNANTKRFKLWVNPTMSGQTTTNGVISGGSVSAGTTICDSGTWVNGTTQNNAAGWSAQANLFKYGAAGSNTQYAQGTPILGALHGGILTPMFLTLIESAAITIVVTGSSYTTGAAGDVKVNFFEVNAMN